MSSEQIEVDAATLHENAPASLEPRPITVAVNPVALVVTECITVTSAMRKHARWAHSSVAAILGGSSNKTPAVQRRDRTGQGIISGGEQEEAVPSRWGLRGKKGKSLQDNPLMSAFARLRNDLKGCKGRCCTRMLAGASLTLGQTSGPSTPPQCYTLSSKSFAPRLHPRRSPRSPSSP
jgi:brefeldin A-resistance guanine nucleotide exchange factor 1